MLQPILNRAFENPELVATLLGGLAGSFAHYNKTGKIPIGRLPWKAGRQVIEELRDEYFGKTRPKGVPAAVSMKPPEEVRSELQSKHFEDVDLSYDYGSVWDMRRPAGTATHPQTGEEVPMELHTRAFRTADDRTLLLSHWEANRYTATGEHLSPSLYSWRDGQKMIDDVLNVELIESEKSAGIEVQ